MIAHLIQTYRVCSSKKKAVSLKQLCAYPNIIDSDENWSFFLCAINAISCSGTPWRSFMLYKNFVTEITVCCSVHDMRKMVLASAVRMWIFGRKNEYTQSARLYIHVQPEPSDNDLMNDWARDASVLPHSVRHVQPSSGPLNLDRRDHATARFPTGPSPVRTRRLGLFTLHAGCRVRQE